MFANASRATSINWVWSLLEAATVGPIARVTRVVMGGNGVGCGIGFARACRISRALSIRTSNSVRSRCVCCAIPVAAFTTAVSPKAMPANAKPTTPTYWTSLLDRLRNPVRWSMPARIADGMSRLSKPAGRPQFTTMPSSYRHTGHSKVRLWQPALSGSTRASHIGLPQFGHDGRPNKSVCWLSFCNDIRSSLRKAR